MEERNTVVWYDVKEKLGLSLSEYTVIELIDRALGGQKSILARPISKARVADYLGMEKSSVFRIVGRLVKKGLLYKGKAPHRNVLVPTDKWYDVMKPYKEKESG